MDGEIVGSRVAAGQRVCVDAEQRQLSWDVRHGPGHSMQPGLEAGHTAPHQPVALPTSELRNGLAHRLMGPPLQGQGSRAGKRN